MNCSLFTFVVSIAVVTASAQVTGSVSLKATPVNQTVNLGDPIRLVVSLKNESSQPISIFQDKSHDASLLYLFDVFDANGNRQCMTEIYAASKKEEGVEDCPEAVPSSKVVVTPQSGYTLQVEPGATVEDTTNLAHIYLFKKAGVYSVQARRKDPLNNRIVKSNRVTITVVNR